MTTTSITGTPTYGTPTSATTKKNTDTTTAAGQQNMFLSMLVEQMKNQDPSSPMDSKDMMAQMSQMTSVEQLTNMASSLTKMQESDSLAQGVSLIGANVTYLDSTDNSVKSGHVDSVTHVAGNMAQLVLASGSKVDINSVTSVS